jgi:hypothetical protein
MVSAGLLAFALVSAAAGQAPAPGPPAAPAPVSAVERISVRPVPLRERPSLLESEPAGWMSVQPGPDLAGWTRRPWPAGAVLGPEQWSVDPVTGSLVCDGKGQHEWLQYDREMGDAAFHVEWRFAPVDGADKYNSGILVRTLPDLSAWHQAQVGLKGGFLFGVTPVEGTAKRVTQEPAAVRVRPAGEWNTFEVLARGRRRSGSTVRSRARSRSTSRAVTSASKPRAGASSSGT